MLILSVRSAFCWLYSKQQKNTNFHKSHEVDSFLCSFVFSVVYIHPLRLSVEFATRLLVATWFCAGIGGRVCCCSSVAYTLERAVLCEGSVELP